MRSIETTAELRHQIATARSRGERVGFVPTLGGLHDGHLELIRTAHAQCDFVVVSVFLNPTQFAAGEDFARYPRTPDVDAEIAAAGGADILWLPDRLTIYPKGSEISVRVGALGASLCGRARPDHFDGVATVVTKLLGAVTPDVMYVGEKDYQQAHVLDRLVRELLIPVEVRLVPTVRSPDGLALSSRNAYLSDAERTAALSIPRALEIAVGHVAEGERSVGRLRAQVEIVLAEADGLEVEYVEFIDPDDLSSVDGIDGATRLLIAARIGSTRLIDNVELVPTGIPAHHATEMSGAPR